MTRLKFLFIGATLAVCSCQDEKRVAQQPDAAGVIVVLGKGEGMSDETYDQLKQACSAAIKSIDPGVYSGVIGFGFGAVTAIPLEMGHSALEVDQKFRELKVNPGVSLALALARAQQMFALQESAVPLKKKLVILLAGGSTTLGDHKKILIKLIGAGTTVSTITLSMKGVDGDAGLDYEIARIGNGYTYLTSRAKECSRILIEEARRVLGP